MAFTLDEIKEIEKGILNFIDRVCKENNIKYYLAYGTLLGAIRHHGFIPWDDDIDVCMKRDDYNRFIEITKNISGQYRLFHFSINPCAYNEYAKIVDYRTKILSYPSRIVDDDGIWVDVFPLDYIPRSANIIRPIIKVCRAIRILSVQDKFPAKHSKLLYPAWLIGRLFGYKYFLKIIDRLSQTAHSGSQLGVMASISIQYSRKYAFPANWFEETVMVPFEEKQYPAPKCYDNYLKLLYGDYMQLPPEEKRVSHPVEADWR